MNKADLSLRNILSLSLAVLLFWIFAFNIWFSNTILNRENFVNTTSQVLTSEPARNAISKEIVEVTQENFPIIGTVTAPIVEKVVVGLLDTELFGQIFRSLSEEIYYQLTSVNPQPLEINIGGVISLIQPFLQEQDQELISNIPQKITLIGKGEIPNISGFANTLALLGPIGLIAGLVIIGFMWRAIIYKRNYFVMLGLIAAASGFLMFSLIPVFGNYLISSISSPNGIFLMTKLYNAFTVSLTTFSVLVLAVGLLIAFIAKFVKRSVFKLSERSTSKS